MKRWLFAGVVLFVCGFAAGFSTQVQFTVAEALEDLEFEKVPKQPGDPMTGGPSKLKVTDDTITYLKGLKKDGKIIQVDSQGDVSVH